MKFSEIIIVYKADIILYSILWAKQGDLVHTENTVSEEPVFFVVSAGQGLWEGWGWYFTGAYLRSQQNHHQQPWKEQPLRALRDI